MSFLNPINEPVLRFKSTDAGAPQIDYNARVAGDVKTVLKACLVTGYGDKASAGWSIVNEVDHVAEFVSPSAAMSDYRFFVDDVSILSTKWGFFYKGSKTVPTAFNNKKKIDQADRGNIANGWELLVTQRGLMFIESLYYAHIENVVSRISYWGHVKTAQQNSDAINMAIWSVGVGSTSIAPPYFFDATRTGYHYFSVADYTKIIFSAANIIALARDYSKLQNTNSMIELSAQLYLYSNDYLVAQHPAVLAKSANAASSIFGAKQITIDNRPYMEVCAAWDTSDTTTFNRSARNILVALDYWEY